MTERGTVGKAIGSILLLALLGLPSSRAGTEPAGNSGIASWSRAEAEAFLRAAAVAEVEKDVQAGRTLPWLVTLEKDGIRARAVFKYVHRPRPHPLAHSYRYELAAYELSKILELEIVPPTVERTVLDAPGALQLFAENCISEHDLVRSGLTPPDPQFLRDSLDTVRLFEALSGASCGSLDDTLIHKDTWKACRVDLAEAFPPNPALPEDCSITRCPRRLYDRLLRMEPASTKERLKAWLSGAEIEALCGRKGQIIADLKKLIESQGEAAVLFPPRP
jgi:hypothetical protein